ncbi:hypothetical protein IscW_ISCW008956 [Ixodes scapularis]|uniref:Uncharacterized protein n=1 Tax=Ixodes scapularis TaxID=6945 RepID=B7PXX4_IXOSC|nr:hypothetical protein IscW_ISCW008956 [Ixodes scapularis]|eukprot:XP_002401990.1 hypothetical protein IscW_ISCW008956 [Ixodes scapularis]
MLAVIQPPPQSELWRQGRVEGVKRRPAQRPDNIAAAPANPSAANGAAGAGFFHAGPSGLPAGRNPGSEEPPEPPTRGSAAEDAAWGKLLLTGHQRLTSRGDSAGSSLQEEPEN